MGTYATENAKLLIGTRNILSVFTNQLEAFPEVDQIVITDDHSFSIFYSSGPGGMTTYVASGFIIRYANFLNYILSCRDVLPEFYEELRNLQTNFDIIDDFLEAIMDEELINVTDTIDSHETLLTVIMLSGVLSMICHEIIHVKRDHASKRRPFLLSQPDDVQSALSDNGQTEFSNIRIRDYEMASFYRALELDADYHSWPNALLRSKMLASLFEEYFSLDIDPYELFVAGLYSVHTCSAYYEAQNLDVDMDLGTTFRTHPTPHNRLLFLRRMLNHLVSSGAFDAEDALYLNIALTQTVSGFEKCPPYPIVAFDVMQRNDQEIMLKDFDNFRKIAIA